MAHNFRATLILLLISTAISCADRPARESRTSPDGRWLMAWNCDGPEALDSCRLALSRWADGKVFFSHTTNHRYIEAVWSGDSSKCVLLSAPDNANSYLWLFRIHDRNFATETLDYGHISSLIEASVPEARRDGVMALTRSGVEKIAWRAPSLLYLKIVYNNIPVVVYVDVAKPNSPNIEVRRAPHSVGHRKH